MKYKNASDILPDKLLKELQRHAAGEMLYVPAESGRKRWGEGSGARKFYSERNEEIRRRFFSGEKLEALADHYALSEETLRKIVYK